MIPCGILDSHNMIPDYLYFLARAPFTAKVVQIMDLLVQQRAFRYWGATDNNPLAWGLNHHYPDSPVTRLFKDATVGMVYHEAWMAGVEYGKGKRITI